MKVYIINSITKSYILNIKIRPLVTEYALMIKLVAEQVPPTRLILMRTSVTRGLIDIQNLRLVILYLLQIKHIHLLFL